MENHNTSFNQVEPRNQIDYMIRTTVQKNTALSGMADQKANILTASSFILVTVLVSRYSELPELANEILVLLFFICLSITFSLISLFPIFLLFFYFPRRHAVSKYKRISDAFVLIIKTRQYHFHFSPPMVF